MTSINVQPGNWAVINTGSDATFPITTGEFLADGFKKTHWDHAVICSQILADGTVMIVEAMSEGAREVPWHYDDRPHAWSAGYAGLWSPVSGSAAIKYVGTPYNWPDYWYIAMYRQHIPWPGLKVKMAATSHLICSQLVDQSCKDAGVHLFNDGRAPGDVMPSDLGHLIGA